MTPAARIQSSIEILDTILSGMATEQALTRWARAHRFAGSKDRAAIRDLVFSTIRCRNSFAFLGGGFSGRSLMIGSIVAENADLSDVFNGVGYGPSVLTEAEHLAVKSTEDLPQLESVDLPDWIWEKFQEDLGNAAQETAEILRRRAPVFLRVNLKKCDRNGAINLLKGEGIEAKPHPLSEAALEVTKNPRRVALSSPYKSGFVELQDAASQAVCDFLAVPKSGSVLDYCAGGGGKSLAMAAKTDATIYAYDANSHRLSDLPERAERASIQLEILENIPDNSKFDLVFCDVPCSGSGSWRRSPDGKWNLTKTGLDDLTGVQLEILQSASVLVQENGELAYATCSLFDCENSALVKDFLSKNPEWSLISERRFGPAQGGDGFYVARMTRV